MSVVPRDASTAERSASSTDRRFRCRLSALGLPGRTLQPRTQVYALLGAGPDATGCIVHGRATLDVGGELALCSSVCRSTSTPLFVPNELWCHRLIQHWHRAAWRFGDVRLGRGVPLQALGGRLLLDRFCGSSYRRDRSHAKRPKAVPWCSIRRLVWLRSWVALAVNHPRCDRRAQPRCKPAALGDELYSRSAAMEAGALAQLDASLGLSVVHRRQLQWAAACDCTWTRLASCSGRAWRHRQRGRRCRGRYYAFPALSGRQPHVSRTFHRRRLRLGHADIDENRQMVRVRGMPSEPMTSTVPAASA